MRVLQINTRYYNGGSTGRITFDLKKVMEANGIESYVAFGFGYNPKDEEKGNVYLIDNFSLVNFGQRLLVIMVSIINVRLNVCWLG